MTCQRVAVGTLLLWATAFAAQTSPSGKTLVPMLPRPSGLFAVGRIGFDWTDRSRSEVLSKDADAKRELMVYVWYPTEKGGKIGKPAPYLPGAAAISKLSDRALSGADGKLWPAILSGELASNAVEDHRSVARGGHDVPEPVVRRRFDRSMQNFLLY